MSALWVRRDMSPQAKRQAIAMPFLLSCFQEDLPRKFPPMPPPKKISARQRVLAQWRGVDLEPVEKARADRSQGAAKVVSKVLGDLKIDSRRAEIEIVKVWNSLLDPTIVAHAQPANLHKGTLFVNVDSNAWLSEIVRYRRKEILERLQQSFGTTYIKKISFRVG